ncbi:NAD(P)/FAD-dependent oxidoreductase [Nocardia spumae]|uniref:NAD(P)/FAD-dependent oxidoreductase n=1 Tax=Nocardia spumae TaxID=2887190 RepID=UPI001D151316|nr:NAD(P)/FAD-dependent oxidoreductase [Nocardia spumae]
MTGAAAVPEPRGGQTFTGERIHCARWDGRRDLRGRRIAVVGTATAVARVLPPVVAQAATVTVFQHDSVWMLPRLPVAGLSAWIPARLARCAARANLRLQVRDGWVRRQLTPEDRSGIRWHSHYYRALQQPNCRLVTWPIATMAPLGIRTVDGIEHRVDCVIFAHTTTPREREQQ